METEGHFLSCSLTLKDLMSAVCRRMEKYKSLIEPVARNYVYHINELDGKCIIIRASSEHSMPVDDHLTSSSHFANCKISFLCVLSYCSKAVKYIWWALKRNKSYFDVLYKMGLTH